MFLPDLITFFPTAATVQTPRPPTRAFGRLIGLLVSIIERWPLQRNGRIINRVLVPCQVDIVVHRRSLFTFLKAFGGLWNSQKPYRPFLSSGAAPLQGQEAHLTPYLMEKTQAPHRARVIHGTRRRLRARGGDRLSVAAPRGTAPRSRSYR